MKSARILKTIASAAVTMAFALNAHAQASDAMSAPAATAAAPVTKATKAANRALAKKVRRALAHTKGLDPTRVYVKAWDGKITLTGSCVSQHQIDLAGRAAQGIEGVVSVANKLTVRSPY